MLMLDNEVSAVISSCQVETENPWDGGAYATLDGSSLTLKSPIETLRVDFWRTTSWKQRMEALSRLFYVNDYEAKDEPTEVIIHGPAVVAYFADGKRTVATCKGGDRFRHAMGVVICAFKRVCGKRERVDEWEDVLDAVCRLSPEQMRTLSRTLSVAADMRDVIGTQASWNGVLFGLSERAPRTAKALKGSRATDDGKVVTVSLRKGASVSGGQVRAVRRAVRKVFGEREVRFEGRTR